MNLNPAAMLNPVFNALDALISDYGVYLYLVFVWLSLAVIAWVLGGGLRRKRQRDHSARVIPGNMFTTQPPNQTSLPIIGVEIDPVQNDDNEIKDEP
jgi:hypothetical protein